MALSFGVLEPVRAPGDKVPAPDTPFRMALLGDFSGRASRGERRDAAALAKSKPVAVSRETLDDVLGRLKVSLRLTPPDGDAIALPFTTLDDFDPDEVYARVEKFEDADDEDEKAALMNALLHDAHFQELEGLWRGLAWLLKRIHKVGSGIEVALFDVTFDELAADLGAGEDLAKSGLYRALVAPAVEQAKVAPWAVLVGGFTFDASAAHIGTLGRLAKVAGVAVAPFLAAAHPRMLTSDFELPAEAASAWNALRQLPEAALLGLATPRLLLRQPYGSSTTSIDRFDYEEFDRTAGPAGYLWLNPAFASACLLGLSFHKESWGFKSGGVLDLDDLPSHVWRDEDGDEQMTVAETWLDRKAVERLVKLGLMPFLSVRGKNAVQLYRFASMAPPPKGQQATDLVGRWGQKGALKVPRSIGLARGPALNLTGGAAPPPPAPKAAAKAEAPEGAADEAPAAEAPSEEAPPPEEAAAEAPPAAEAAAEPEMDPELAALLQQIEGGTPGEAAPAPEAPPAEEMDPELAALLAQIESGTPPETPPAAAPEAAPPAPPAEEMDPELAALLAQIEGGAPAATPEAPAAEAPPEPAAPPAEETDPELAALLAQIEEGEPSAPAAAAAEAPPAAEAPSPPAEETDPELAALLAQIEGGEPAAPAAQPAPAEQPRAQEMDLELAALLHQLEGGEAAASAAAPAAEPEPTAAPAPAVPAGETVDPELAALLQQLDGGTETPPAAPAAAEPEPAAAAEPAGATDPELAALMQQIETGAPAAPDLQEQIDALGGAAALEALGWPTFAPAFTADKERLLRLLQKSITNKTVEKEVADLAKKCGGYATLAGDGIRADLPLGERLRKLRDYKKVLDADRLLADQDMLAMADAYGASVKKAATPAARSELLAQVRDYDKWAADARNASAAAALDGCPFKERRQVQLEQQLKVLGGDEAFTALRAAHPAGWAAKVAGDQKVAALKAAKDYAKAGGDEAFAATVGGDAAAVPLAVKLEQLKTVAAARE
jgi:hypothetical protein